MTWAARVNAACLALCLLLVAEPAAGSAGPDEMFVVALNRPPDGDVAEVTAQATRLTRRYGGRVNRVYAAALRGFSVSMTPKQARLLEADRRVAMVERNRVFAAQDSSQDVAWADGPWGLDRINQRALPLDGLPVRGGSAAGVTAYLVDSGLRTTHTEFGGRAGYGYDAVDYDDTAQDCFGHGTHVAGILGGRTYGVARDVNLVGVRVLNCQGFGTTAEIVAGVDWVTQHAHRPAVVNMSLQSRGSQAIDRAVRKSIETGLPYVVSAGNQGGDACRNSPSRVREAITVGATNAGDQRAPFSNDGACVDLFAPGAGIESAWNTGDEASELMSGTSMASPHVAGAVALLLAAHPRATPAQLASLLLDQSTPGVVTDAGESTPNRLLYVKDELSDLT